jgi:hypothetical protein
VPMTIVTVLACGCTRDPFTGARLRACAAHPLKGPPPPDPPRRAPTSESPSAAAIAWAHLHSAVKAGLAPGPAPARPAGMTDDEASSAIFAAAAEPLAGSAAADFDRWLRERQAQAPAVAQLDLWIRTGSTSP